MKLITVITSTLCVAVGIVNATPSKYGEEQAARYQLAKWAHQYDDYIETTARTHKTGCTPHNIVHRQEWGSLSKKNRKEYISAVQCLIKKPALYPKSEVPGGRSRFDDFAALHIKEAPVIHFDGVFFHWHRYFLWLYEKALRDECGYKGAHPYWDWTLHWEDQTKSPVFDGSPYSMGSNGKSIEHGVVEISAFGITIPLQPGAGGGCVAKGPFSDLTINLGPVAFTPLGPKSDPQGLGYNPRCLARDIHPEWNALLKPSDIVRVIKKCNRYQGSVNDTGYDPAISKENDLGCFDSDAEGGGGFHTAGHFAIGGIASDPWASPQDPAFFLHHAMVDKTWSLWQSLRRGRTGLTYGTQTALNVPPSENATLGTEMEFGRLGKNIKLGETVSTVEGPFCYKYI